MQRMNNAEQGKKIKNYDDMVTSDRLLDVLILTAEGDPVNVGIVIPAYNEEKNLDTVLSKTKKFIPADRIYLVDDGSSDATAAVARRHGVRVERHPENRGKGEALKSGFCTARSDAVDYVITMDADGQHSPASIPDFLNAARTSGGELILGCRRFCAGTMPLDRIFSNRISSRLVSALAGCRIPDSQCGYRMIRTDLLDRISLHTRHYDTETELLVKAVRAGGTLAFIEIPVIYDGAGSSNIKRFRDTLRFCRLYTRLLCDRS